ncbi:hypothetical protein GF342_01140 [Candidatus Woesearchaeota archaeon]|nr:hypothetical protein [Candidatus Woesearchaeota archaeon]
MVILFDRFNFPSDVFAIIFATDQQIIVAKELIKYMLENNSEVTKTQMSLFATKLHDGEYETTLEDGQYHKKRAKLSYNKRQFYDRILTPMKSMGLVKYDMYKKTYRISTDFSNALMRIGVMWKERLKRMGYKEP